MDKSPQRQNIPWVHSWVNKIIVVLGKAAPVIKTVQQQRFLKEAERQVSTLPIQKFPGILVFGLNLHSFQALQQNMKRQKWQADRYARGLQGEKALDPPQAFQFAEPDSFHYNLQFILHLDLYPMCFFRMRQPSNPLHFKTLMNQVSTPTRQRARQLL